MTPRTWVEIGCLLRSLHGASWLRGYEACPCAVKGRTLTASGPLRLLSHIVHEHPHLLLVVVATLLRDPPPRSLDVFVRVRADRVPGGGGAGSAASRARALARVVAADRHTVRPGAVRLGGLHRLDRLRCAAVVHRSNGNAVLVLLVLVPVEVHVVRDGPVHKLV